MQPRRTTRITPLPLAAALIAVVLAFGLSACNPAKGQAGIKLSGPGISGSARGPKVTCSSTTKVNTRTWAGTIGKTATEVEFRMNKVTGDDWIMVSWPLSGGGIQIYMSDSDKDIVTIDSAKVAHYSGKVGSPTEYVTLTAALACP